MLSCDATFHENVGGSLRAAIFHRETNFWVAAGTAPPTFGKSGSGALLYAQAGIIPAISGTLVSFGECQPPPSWIANAAGQ